VDADPAVVVVNFASHALLASNLERLGELPIVVVDNFSTAEERLAMRALSAERRWHLVEMPANDGFGAGVNAGVRAAIAHGHQIFVLLNPDAVVEAEVIRQLGRHLAAEPMTLLSPRVENPDGSMYYAGYVVLLSSGRMRRAEGAAPVPPNSEFWISGACMAFARELFEAVCGYDERYFLYWEDVDFSIRASRAGARLQVVDDLVAIHREGGTQGERQGRAKSNIYYRYNCRNRLVFAAHNLSVRQLLVWMILTPRESWHILLGGGRRQLLHSLRPLVAIMRGSLEGLAIAFPELARRFAARLGGPQRRASRSSG
jgi:N-acetylglucosaminyl-diphospho-decaprenol L-rhamnosyltransferase